MTVLWRISNHADLSGKGGLHSAARWHSAGHRIVYLAESPAGALVEMLVHLELVEHSMPDTYQLLKVKVPASVSRELVSKNLPEHWQDHPEHARALGDEWLSGRRSALLGVPSAVVGDTRNWLLNPAHPQARRLKVQWARRFPVDGRLFRTNP